MKFFTYKMTFYLYLLDLCFLLLLWRRYRSKFLTAVSKLIMEEAFNRSSTTIRSTSRSGYDMLTSVEDLIGRMVVASERKVSQCVEPDLALLALGFPYPSEATNDQLSILQSFYTKLLRNIEDNNDNDVKGSESESILTRLDKSEDDAMFLLYVLKFPLLVLTARKGRILPCG